MRCWEERGCKGALAPNCPHNATGICPRNCMYTVCDRDWYDRADAMAMLDAFDVDFGATRKENCHNCKFFLKNAPRIA